MTAFEEDDNLDDANNNPDSIDNIVTIANDRVLLVASVLTSLLIVIGCYYSFRKRTSCISSINSNPISTINGATRSSLPLDSAAGDGEVRRRARGRQGRRGRAAPETIDNDSGSSSEEPGDDSIVLGREARKKAEKQARKQEKKDVKQHEAHLREEKLKLKKAKEEVLAKKQAQKDLEIAKIEEAEARALEEKKTKEMKEYLRWKSQFSVECEGEANSDNLDEKKLLEKFVKYIKSRKAVTIEQLATGFELKSQDAIDRLQHLEELGRLSGIFDDRGKYIYIEETEMDKLVDYLTQKGRVSVTEDLVPACNDIIRLNPTQEAMQDIEEDERKALKIVSATLDQANDATAN